MKEFEEEKKFYDDFADKFEVFDPLERPIPDENNNCIITVQELKQALMEMKPIISDKHKLNVPLNNKLYEKLDKMINQELDGCIDISKDFMAREYEEDLPHKYNAQIE